MVVRVHYSIWCAKGLRFALRAPWRLWRGMRTCGELAELARTADFLGFDAFCRELCKSSSESYANRPVELDDLGKRSIRRQRRRRRMLPSTSIAWRRSVRSWRCPKIRGTLSTAAVRFSRRAMGMCSRCARRTDSWCRSWCDRASILVGAMRRCR